MSNLSPKHSEFVRQAERFVDKSRIYTDDLRRLAWGTDAGFYRLIPQVVVRAKDEAEVSRLLQTASALNLPVTFRAAGTSLSGQSITDSILIVAGKNWENYTIHGDDAAAITLQPGIIGGRVNQILAPYGRMFAPDPASKNSAMVGGIVINNASGMNCGTHANSDRIMRSARIVLADGTVLDTSDKESCDAFRKSHPAMVAEIESIRDDIRADEELCKRILHKYSIKNVTGLNLLPFVLFDDPFEIIAHSMVGSEGTLAFLSSVTVNTSHLYPCSASAMAYFKDLAEACRAVVALKKSVPVYSCEMLDKKSLASVNDTTGESLTALLFETKADDQHQLADNVKAVEAVLKDFDLYKPARFTTDPEEVAAMWSMRSGVFPAVGGTRPLGTTSLIEDIAFHIEDLPKATVELAQMLVDCGYDDACIYGHAFEGNYHFVIAQAFDTQAEIDRYSHLMKEIEKLVVDRYDGSLKAEHGTGRNMAPFVEKEWGTKAWQMMQRVKKAFDPQGILNPGVIFNDDPECYLRNLKPLPLCNPRVDRCIECGFCEVNCVSCGLTLSARQRIVSQREIKHLEETGSDPERLANLKKQFKYYGNETCAGDGLCSTSCPMKINTGEMIHDLREQNLPKGSLGYSVGDFAARHLGGVCSTLRPILGAASIAHAVLGDKGVEVVGSALHHIGVPLWTPSLPKPKWPYNIEQHIEGKVNGKVVYFPSCINRTMGASSAAGETDNRSLVEVMVSLCNKAGFEVVFPENMNGLCCGMIWESKGMPDIADQKTAQLEKVLAIASDGGKLPVMCDQSPCLHRMRDKIKGMKLYEPAEFIVEFLANHLEFTPVDKPVAVHVTCSSRLMGLAPKIIGLAQKCSTRVLVPTEVGCCGFAGDKGFTHPELNRWGLRKLKDQVLKFGAKEGYSNSRTCEVGLTTNSGIPYKGIAYLVDAVTKSKNG